jgi:phosphatidylglycerophosphatase A
MSSGERTAADRLIVFVAEGFGSGRFPKAPGTIGTLVGLIWIYLLLIPGNVPIYFGGSLLGFFAAIWFGGKAEQILARKDPGSIVIDEMAALPIAFGGAVVFFCHGFSTPEFSFYLHGKRVLLLLVAFVGFRFFDIAKPWIIGRSQSLPGGWGLAMDDLLAALPVAPLTYLCALAV